MKNTINELLILSEFKSRLQELINEHKPSSDVVLIFNTEHICNPECDFAYGEDCENFNHREQLNDTKKKKCKVKSFATGFIWKQGEAHPYTYDK